MLPTWRDLGGTLRKLSIAALAAAILVGCAGPTAPGGDAPPSIAAVQAFPAAIELASGESIQLQAQANDAAGQPVGGARFSYTTDDASMLSVDEIGHVLARGPAGRTRVWVTSAAIRIEVPVRVRPGPPAQLRFASDETLRVVAGEPVTAAVAVLLLDAAGNPVPGAMLRFGSGNAAPAHEAVTAEDGSASWLPELPTRAGPAAISVATVMEPKLEARVDVLVEAATPTQLRDAPGAADPASQESTLFTGSVRALDEFGNPVADATVEWLPSLGCGAVKRADATTLANGVAMIAMATPERRKPGCVLKARVRGTPVETPVSLAGPAQQ